MENVPSKIPIEKLILPVFQTNYIMFAPTMNELLLNALGYIMS